GPAAGHTDVEAPARQDEQSAAGTLDIDVTRGCWVGTADCEIQCGDDTPAEDREFTGTMVADGQAAGQCQRRAGAGHNDDAVASAGGSFNGVDRNDDAALRDLQQSKAGIADSQPIVDLPTGTDAIDADERIGSSGRTGDDGAVPLDQRREAANDQLC